MLNATGECFVILYGKSCFFYFSRRGVHLSLNRGIIIFDAEKISLEIRSGWFICPLIMVIRGLRERMRSIIFWLLPLFSRNTRTRFVSVSKVWKFRMKIKNWNFLFRSSKWIDKILGKIIFSQSSLKVHILRIVWNCSLCTLIDFQI